MARQITESRVVAGGLSWARLLKRIYPYVLLAPTIITLLLVLVWPMLSSLRLSFYAYNILRPDLGERFVGLENYARLLQSDQFWTSVKVTLLFTAVAIVVEFVLGLVFALLLNRADLVAMRFIRTIILIPFFATPVAVALAWKFMLHTEFGMLNYFIGLLHVPPQVWLGVDLALPSVIAVEVWQNTSFVILILLAGLQSLPVEPYESAILDGANSWQLFTKITLPMLRPVILVALVFRTMFTLRVFDVIWVLTGGGPANSTRTLSIAIYLTGFRTFDLGRGAALSWVLLLITMVISLVYWRYLSGEVDV
ncbi:MAG: sugar ABC transporter permease [Ardenticatenaceae bacterium]|nr:sugar ABC transporter permease [Ardenticatenaceae bacterium]HBY93128.1 sugar ABC transporter permease [Chloroflexota bacterium]